MYILLNFIYGKITSVSVFVRAICIFLYQMACKSIC